MKSLRSGSDEIAFVEGASSPSSPFFIKIGVRIINWFYKEN
jgi:hypothetical protein